MVTAGEIVRAARKEAKRTGRSEIDIIREKSQKEVDKQKKKKSNSLRGGSKKAGQIVREAREEAKQTGRSEIEVIKEKSEQEVAKPTPKPEPKPTQAEEAREDFKPVSTVRSAEPQTITEKLILKQRQLETKGDREFYKNPLKGQGLKLAAFGVGAATPYVFAVTQPIQFSKGLLHSVLHPVKTTKLLATQAKINPAGTAGQLVGTAGMFKGGGIILKKQPIRVTAQTTKIRTATEFPTVKEITPDSLLFDKPTAVTTTKKVSSIGVEAGTKSVIIGSKTPSGLKLGGVKGKGSIELSTIREPVAAPVSATGTKALTQTLKLTAEETARIKEVQKAASKFQGEKGLKVKEFTLNIEQLKNPKRSSKVIDKFIGEEKGVAFGTALNEPQLGIKFKAGDIDVVFPKRTVAELTPKIENLAKELNLGGEQLRVSKDNPLILETAKREKIVEAKSGIDQEIIGDDSPAPVGGLGFRFGNLKAGVVGDTVKFGKGRSIKAGEQFTRKGVASIFFRGKDTAAPKGFTDPGVLPAGRRTKDIGGFVIQGRAIADIRGKSFNPLKRRGAKKGGKAVEDFLETYTKEQQKGILKEIETRTGTKQQIELSKPKPSKPKTPSPLSISKVLSPSPKLKSPYSKSVSPSFSPSRKLSSSLSGSPRISSKLSASPKPSKSPSPLISSVIGSPSISPPPRSPSPYKPGSPSKSIFGSPSPYGYGSPSPSPSPSPFRILPPPPTTPGINFPKGFLERKSKTKKKKSRYFKYNPSLVASEGRIYGKKPGILTGIEVRNIIR